MLLTPLPPTQRIKVTHRRKVYVVVRDATGLLRNELP
jgi:hypothetical protein